VWRDAVLVIIACCILSTLDDEQNAPAADSEIRVDDNAESGKKVEDAENGAAQGGTATYPFELAGLRVWM